MKREILFRGKAIKNTFSINEEEAIIKIGDWVYGAVIPFDDGIDLIYERDPNNPKICGCHGIEVDHNTVGQYTGLHDCNGNEIFEGDILRYTRHNVRGEGIHNETWVHECIVYWDEEKHAFWHRMKLSCGSCSGLLIFKDERAEKEEIEIIGNIHEK